MERETGIEPATNSLEGCDSTTELLPPSRSPTWLTLLFGGQARLVSFSYIRSRLASVSRPGAPIGLDNLPTRTGPRPREPPRLTTVAAAGSGAPKVGGEGRTRTFEATWATDLQSAAFDRFATSPMICLWNQYFDAFLPTGRSPVFGAGEGI